MDKTVETANGPLGLSGAKQGNGRTNPTQNLVDAFLMKDGHFIKEGKYEYNEQLPYAQRDPRLEYTIIHNGSEDCTGLIIVEEGQLRAYTLSEDGKEITLYRMFQRDACLFAASCIMNNIQFEVIIEAREDSKVLTIPTSVYQNLIHTSLPVANFTNDLMASRFAEGWWVMEQILNKSVDVRLAALLVEEMEITGESMLKMTHEEIAHHLGTAREVITRMLKYFQKEQLVSLSRGSIEIIDEDRLYELAKDSRR